MQIVPMRVKNLFENTVLRTRITSSNVNIQEMAIGYFLAPMWKMDVEKFARQDHDAIIARQDTLSLSHERNM